MARFDRLKGIIGVIQTTLNRSIGKLGGAVASIREPSFDENLQSKDFYGKIINRALPITRELVGVSIPKSVAPLTDKYRYNRFTNQYHERETNLFITRETVKNILSDQRRDVLLATVRRKNRSLSDSQIYDLVADLTQTRRDLNDLADTDPNIDQRLKLEGELEDIQRQLWILYK